VDRQYNHLQKTDETSSNCQPTTTSGQTIQSQTKRQTIVSQPLPVDRQYNHLLKTDETSNNYQPTTTQEAED